MPDVLKFPSGFFWGAATSAYQVEGGIKNCDWAKVGETGKVPAAGRACNHYHFYPKDFDWAHKLGHNAHRFSLEWSRLEPKPGKFDSHEMEHYLKVVTALRSRHLEPIITLWHFTLPQWLAQQGGWQNPLSVKYFCRYVAFVTERLKNRVNFWLTINEPEVYLLNGYLSGLWPPFKKSWRAGLIARRHLYQAHQAAFPIIKQKHSQSQVGLAFNLAWFVPACYYAPWDWLLVYVCRYLNNWFLPRLAPRWTDFLAINYYRRQRMRLRIFPERQVPVVRPNQPLCAGLRTQDNIMCQLAEPALSNNELFACTFPRNGKGWWREVPQGELTDMGWEIYPQGLYLMLKKLKKYHLPIYITENGLADGADSRRKKFIGEHLYWLHQAIQEGIDVRGYFHWSLMDNFEWAYGFKPRFGLLAVDYRTQKRTARPSAWEYAKICQTNQLKSQNSNLKNTNQKPAPYDDTRSKNF